MGPGKLEGWAFACNKAGMDGSAKANVQPCAGAVVWGFANMDVTWDRQTRAELDELVAGTDLEDQMTMLGIWSDWTSGRRGRQDR